MKAAVVHAWSSPPRYQEFEPPVAHKDEVVLQMRAIGIHPIVKALASGTHYASTEAPHFIPGIDGVGVLQDGTRVYVGMPRHPYGTLAEYTVVPEHLCMPLPDELDDITAAAIFNPGLSAYLALKWRAQLQPGETVLVNGAAGVAGKLALQIAKHLGAATIIGVGRGPSNRVDLDQPFEQICTTLRAAVPQGIDVIIDYLWGSATETLIAAISQKGWKHKSSRTRLVEVGDAAGKTLTLPAATLRSSGLEIYGSGLGTTPMEQMIEAVPLFTDLAAKRIVRIDTQTAPLSSIETIWNQPLASGRRLVITTSGNP